MNLMSYLSGIVRDKSLIGVAQERTGGEKVKIRSINLL